MFIFYCCCLDFMKFQVTLSFSKCTIVTFFMTRSFILCVFVCCGCLCHAQQEDVFLSFADAYKRVYHAKKYTNVNITVDGKLDEDIWTDSEGWTEDFMVVVPVERLVPKSKTRAKIFFDDKYLYCGYYCKEVEPEKMNPFIGNRDERFTGDNVAIALDTYHDFRAAIEFNINMGGNKTDLVVLDDLELNLSWNAVWEARTQINRADSSWTAEFRIPFSQMRYNYKDTTGIWGMNLRRNVHHNSEMHKWSLIPKPNAGHVYSFGELHGMLDLPKPKGFEFLPYTMGKFRTDPRIKGSPYQTGSSWNGNVGVDSKIALSDFTLDVTINPDYGQVELDPSVMNLTALETFYEEKRPFFLEGRHLLDFKNGSDMMFYTRRLGASPSYHPEGIDNTSSFIQTKENIPIIGALKLTGTNRKGLSLGIIQSVTAKTFSKVTRNGDENSEVVEPLTNYSAIRLRKNWKGNTLLGGMITSVNRDLSEPYLTDKLIRNAFTAGIDFTQYFANRLYYIDFKSMFSSLYGSKEAVTLLQERPSHYFQRESGQGYLGIDQTRTSLSGTGGWIEIGRKGTNKWFFVETFGWSSPGFDLNDMGFMKSTDYFFNKTEISYRQKGIWKKMRANTLSLSQENRWDFGKSALNNFAAINWSTTFLNQMQFSIKEIYGWNYITTSMLRGGPDMRFDNYFNTTMTFNTDKGKKLMAQIKYEGDYKTDGYNHWDKITPALTWRVGNHVYIVGEFMYHYNINNLQYVDIVRETVTNAPKYVMGRMYQNTYGLTLKLWVNITPDISVQYYGSPFTSTGRFEAFKVATAETKSHVYTNKFIDFASNEITYSETDRTYSVSRTGENYSFKNPDFSFNEFRSNLVARWEYRPGSTLYFVWEHAMSSRDNYHITNWKDNLDRMFGLAASNVFMIKLNYWLSM